MNNREKEQYLREYSVLKGQGKPFFPYAVTKDGMMAVIVMFVIILMAVLFGAELQPKADPTTTTYSPRPEWYFFFLFELLRVVKPPALVIMATLGIPTICLILLLLLPFYDRGPERHPLKRPIAMVGAVATIVGMAYLTILGAITGPPTEIDVEVAAQYEEGKVVAATSGCLYCHKIGENGNTIGPNLTHIGDRLGRDAIARTLINPTEPMPSYEVLQHANPEQFDQLVSFVASLKEDMPEEPAPPEPSPQASAGSE
ncbi:MAG: c-type cytochrome [Thermoleophilaceae bacterium]